MYRITASKTIQWRRDDGSGSRNRQVDLGDGSTVLLTFDRRPLYLSTLPPEIEADEHLVVKTITAKKMEAEGGTETKLSYKDKPAKKEPPKKKPAKKPPPKKAPAKKAPAKKPPDSEETEAAPDQNTDTDDSNEGNENP